MAADPFEGLFSVEDDLYEEGYRLGQADGLQAGRLEGRAFGIEKGFEKFVAMGRVQGQSAILSARLRTASEATASREIQSLSVMPESSSRSTLPPLPENARLEKHVASLGAMADPRSVSTRNTEDAVSNFDDRLKRLVAKIKVVERMVGQGSVSTPTNGRGVNGRSAGSMRPRTDRASEGNIEDFESLAARS